MQLVKCTDPKNQGITLEQTPVLSVMVAGDWTVKSYHGSDDNWYEKMMHTDGRVRWYRLDEDD